MTDYVESGVRLIGDTEDASSKMEELISLADSIDSLSPTLTVDTEVGDTSAVDDITALDGSQINTEIDTKEGGDKVGGKSLLTTLYELGINPMQIVMNIAGTILDLAGMLNQFAIQPLLDIDTAVAHINAQTGNAIPNARELLNTLYPADIGDIDAIASALTHAQQLGLPLEDATKAALEFVKVFPENDPNNVLDALDQMVKNKLAPDIVTAADLLTTAEQQGVDKGKDLISVFERSSGAIKDLGLTGDEFLSLAKTDLAGGGASAQTFLDTLTKIKAGLQGGNKNSTDALKVLGIPDPATTGTGYTEEFFKSVATAIKNFKGTDAEKQALFQSLVGGKLGQKDYEGFLNIDAAQPSLDALTGATDKAATEMDNSLSGAIDDFVLAAQTAAMDFLSSEQIDLPGKIAALKTGLQDALNVLQGGGDLGTALTVGLKPIGFDDEFQKLEAVFGNFIISLLQVIASIQDITGHGKEAAGTRATITEMGQQQLAFDLKLGNASEVAQDIETAVSRGVTPEGISAAASTAVSELVKAGSLDAAQALVDNLKGGQVNFSVVGATTRAQLAGQGLPTDLTVPINPEMTTEQVNQFIADKTAEFAASGIDLEATISPRLDDTAIADLQKQVNAGKIIKDIEVASQGGVTPTAPVTADQLKSVDEGLDAVATSSTTLSTNTDTLKTSTDAAATSVTAQTTATTDLSSASGQATLANSDLGRGIYDTIAAYEGLNTSTDESSSASHSAGVEMQALTAATGRFSVAVEAAIASIDSAANAANSVATGGNDTTTTHPGKKAAGGSFKGLSWVGEAGPELVGSGKELSVLNNRTSRALMQALSGMPFMQMGGRGGDKSLTINNNYNVPNQAMASNISYDIGQQVRGF